MNDIGPFIYTVSPACIAAFRWTRNLAYPDLLRSYYVPFEHEIAAHPLDTQAEAVRAGGNAEGRLHVMADQKFVAGC